MSVAVTKLTRPPVDDDDELPARQQMPSGRRAFRLTMMGLYASVSVAIFVYAATATVAAGSTLIFFYLLGFYMAARCAAMIVKYRQDTRPPRYTRAYIEARDLVPPSAKPDDDENGSSSKKGNRDG